MSLDDTLSHIDAQLQEMQAALLSLDPQLLEQAAIQLREAVLGLAQAMGPGVPEDMTERVLATATQLNLVRNQLARVQALTERQAASLLPPVQGVTYGPAGGAQRARLHRASR